MPRHQPYTSVELQPFNDSNFDCLVARQGQPWGHRSQGDGKLTESFSNQILDKRSKVNHNLLASSQIEVQERSLSTVDPAARCAFDRPHALKIFQLFSMEDAFGHFCPNINHETLRCSRHTPFREQRRLQTKLRHKPRHSRSRRQQQVSNSSDNANQSERTKVVILGGTGRVGSSTAVALLRKDPHLDVVVGSREQDSFNRAVKKRPKLDKARFEQVDHPSPICPRTDPSLQQMHSPHQTKLYAGKALFFCLLR